MHHRAIDRRSFLRGVGASAALLPFLPAQLASAAQATGPKRLVIWWTPMGMFHPEYTPDGIGAEFAFRRVLEPLAHHRARVLLLQNLNFDAYFATPINNDHEACVYGLTGATVTTGGAGTFSHGPSVDQYVAQRLARPGAQDGLVLGVRSYVTESKKLIWRKAREPVPAENSPAAAWKRLFGGGTSASDATLRLDRKSVIDNVRLELQALGKRLAMEDRGKLEAHLDFIRGQEQRLAMAGAACGAPPAAASGALSPMEQDARLQADNVVAAFQCDLSRVATVVLSAQGGAGNIVYDWLPGVTAKHHDLSHGGRPKPGDPVYEQLTAIGRFHARNLAYFLDRLAATKEGNGTLLDNTVVVWTSEHAGNKPGADDHSRKDVPYLLVGSCGGHFRTGRVIDFKARANNDLLVSLCNAMGFADVTTFGDPNVCKGPLPGLEG